MKVERQVLHHCLDKAKEFYNYVDDYDIDLGI